MKTAIMFVMLASCVVTGYAADTDQVAQECLNVLNKNFQAVVYEDADALLATISPDAGPPSQFKEFRGEADKMFASTDVYMHCAAFQLVSCKPPFAEAIVVQQTVPKSESEHYPLKQGKLNFRHHSALLPEHKLVVYKQRFHQKNGEWKMHVLVTAPKPVSDADVQKIRDGKVSNSACKNGKCSSPFITVR